MPGGDGGAKRLCEINRRGMVKEKINGSPGVDLSMVKSVKAIL
jgi:hypothetical protein